MTTYAPRTHMHRPHVNLWLVAVVGLAAALIGLGSWIVVDRTTGGGGATHDATTLIDNLGTAFSTGDPAAIASYYANDAVIWSMGATYTGLKAIRGLADGSFTAERIAPVTVVENANGTFASTFVKLTDVGGGTTGTTVSVFQIKDGKVLRQWNFQPGSTPPFDNAVISSF